MDRVENVGEVQRLLAAEAPESRYHCLSRAGRETEKLLPDWAVRELTFDRGLNTKTGRVFRVVEWALALGALIVSLPFCLIVALIIRLDSKGPVLFFQERIGRNGKLFRFVKFRTMVIDARERFPELYAYKFSTSEIASVKFKLQNDPRLTRAGRWLRKTSLDELPNFWNVLTGDMALVGPRPDIPDMLPYYSGDDHLKFAVRPGITGLAQTCGRGELSFRDTIYLDVSYVRIRSFTVDLRILLRTLRMVVLGRGAF